MTNSGERSSGVVFPARDIGGSDTLARHVSRVSAVFDAAPIGVGVWSLEGVLVHANPVLCDLVGRTLPGLAGELFESFIDPAEAPAIRQSVEDLWHGTRNFFECSFLCLRPDGSDLWLRTQVLAVYGPGGRPEYLISQIFNFVSGWAVDQGPNALADQSPVMLWVTDDQGVPRNGNRRCIEFLGQFSNDDPHNTLYEIVHPEDYERVRAPIRAALAAREPFEFSARSRRHDGQWRWLHNRATPVFDGGVFQGYSGASFDVTDDIRHRHRLEDIERLFESVAEAGPLAMLRTDAVGRVRYANGRWAALLEDPDVRLTGLGWRSVVAPEHGEEIIERGRRARDTGEPFVMRVLANDAFISNERKASGFDGRHWAELRVAPVFDADGVHDGFVATIADITDEVAAGERADQLARVLDAGTDFLLLVERNGAITYANEAAEDGLGIRADLGQFLMDVLDPDSFTFFHDVVEPVLVEAGRWKRELTMRDALQREVPVSALVLAQSSEVGHLDTISIVARDISDLKQAQWSMRQLATHDYLTGLPNRLLLYEHLDQALARFHRLGQTVALLYLDLDRFKPINDELGHHVGDAVIVTLADRIHAVVRDTDTPARIGGDEFAVLVEGFETTELLERVATRLIDSIREPITVDGITVHVGVSIGIVAADADTAEADQMLARADAAMYEAKARGRGQFVFAPLGANGSASPVPAPDDPTPGPARPLDPPSGPAAPPGR
jgi:diguanylate cyclase (GGDEF)-like protein/PAS domain S-box-containing protein